MAPHRRIRAVLFDLGGTLVDEHDYLGWTEIARRFYFDFEPEALAKALSEVELETDREGGVPLEELWRRVLERAGGREVSLISAQRFCEAVRASPAPGHLYSDVRRCLEELAAERRRLGILSNSSSEAGLREILERTGILPFFAEVVSSGTEGVDKPDPEIFRRAVHRLGVSVEEALYVGNLPHTDARAAALAGLASLWLHRAGTGFGEDPPEITSLLEVPNCVRRIEGSAERYPVRRR